MRGLRRYALFTRLYTFFALLPAHTAPAFNVTAAPPLLLPAVMEPWLGCRLLPAAYHHRTTHRTPRLPPPSTTPPFLTSAGSQALCEDMAICCPANRLVLELPLPTVPTPGHRLHPTFLLPPCHCTAVTTGLLPTGWPFAHHTTYNVHTHHNLQFYLYPCHHGHDATRYHRSPKLAFTFCPRTAVLPHACLPLPVPDWVVVHHPPTPPCLGCYAPHSVVRLPPPRRGPRLVDAHTPLPHTAAPLRPLAAPPHTHASVALPHLPHASLCCRDTLPGPSWLDACLPFCTHSPPGATPTFTWLPAYLFCGFWILPGLTPAVDNQAVRFFPLELPHSACLPFPYATHGFT